MKKSYTNAKNMGHDMHKYTIQCSFFCPLSWCVMPNKKQGQCLASGIIIQLYIHLTILRHKNNIS